MNICIWAGDAADEYCKSCDGCTMMVEGIEKSCAECNGYEPGDVDVDTDTGEVTEESMNPPVEETPVKTTQKANTKAKSTKTTNTTPKEEKPVKKENTKSQKVEKVAEVKEQEETLEGIKVVSIRYTSGATVKRGDNYYKFIAEEEWNVENANVEEAREKLWAKLNAEVDSQIEELNNM